MTYLKIIESFEKSDKSLNGCLLGLLFITIKNKNKTFH